MGWPTVGGAMTPLTGKKYVRRYVLELVRAAVLWKGVGARLVGY